MRVAVFTPLSPVRTALSDILEGLLPYWVGSIDVTCVTSGGYCPDNPLVQRAAERRVPWITYDEFQLRAGDFDLVVYNLGDEARIHGYMFHALHRYPGLVMLNDLVLHHAIAGLTWAQGDVDAYLAELRYSYGDKAEGLLDEVNAGRYEEVFNGHPLVERVLDSSLGVIVYNGYMVDQVRARCPDLPVHHIPYQFHLPQGLGPDWDGTAFRRELKLADRPVIASFGLFNSQKRLELSLRAFRRLVERHPRATYLLVGSYLDPELERRLGPTLVTDNIVQVGWQPSEQFVRYMKVVDVAVQLRYPHVGGTPYTPIRLLGLRVPTIISDIEPLADFPDDAVVRIPPEHADEEGLLLAAVDYLLSHPEVAEAMGRRGREYVRTHHDVRRIAQAYMDVFREVAAAHDELEGRMRARKRARLVRSGDPSPLTGVAAGALAALGFCPSDARALRSIAQTIASLDRNRES